MADLTKLETYVRENEPKRFKDFTSMIARNILPIAIAGGLGFGAYELHNKAEVFENQAEEYHITLEEHDAAKDTIRTYSQSLTSLDEQLSRFEADRIPNDDNITVEYSATINPEFYDVAIDKLKIYDFGPYTTEIDAAVEKTLERPATVSQARETLQTAAAELEKVLADNTYNLNDLDTIDTKEFVRDLGSIGTGIAAIVALLGIGFRGIGHRRDKRVRKQLKRYNTLLRDQPEEFYEFANSLGSKELELNPNQIQTVLKHAKKTARKLPVQYDDFLGLMAKHPERYTDKDSIKKWAKVYTRDKKIENAKIQAEEDAQASVEQALKDQQFKKDQEEALN